MGGSDPPRFTDSPSPGVGKGMLDVSEPAPRYEDDLWSHWEKVDEANSIVNHSQALLLKLESELQAKTKENEKLKVKSSQLFENAHRKPIGRPPAPWNCLKRSILSVTEEKALARRKYELAHKDETTVAGQVEALKVRIKNLKETIQDNFSLASTADQTFELLGASVAANFHQSDTDTTAEENLALASEAYNQMQQTVSDFTRARVTVQHAHHYYTIVLKTIDAIRGTTIGRAAVGGLGEVSKQKDYKVAMDTSAKAQVCYNEAARMLTPHTTKMPPNILEDFEVIKERGLIQASKIYGFMYGWQSKTSRVRESVEVLLQRQEEVFKSLTHLAVWVQESVPSYEAQLRALRDSRDQRRRDLVALWKGHQGGMLPFGMAI